MVLLIKALIHIKWVCQLQNMVKRLAPSEILGPLKDIVKRTRKNHIVREVQDKRNTRKKVKKLLEKKIFQLILKNHKLEPYSSCKPF